MIQIIVTNYLYQNNEHNVYLHISMYLKIADNLCQI